MQESWPKKTLKTDKKYQKNEAVLAKLTQPHHSADTWCMLLTRNKTALLACNKRRARNTADEKQGQDSLD